MADIKLDFVGPGARLALTAAKRIEGIAEGAVPAIDAARDEAVDVVQTEGAAQVAQVTEQRELAEAAAGGAQEAYENTLITSAGIVLPNYDPYFTSFLDAAVDIDGRIMDTAADFRGAPYETPLKSWATPRLQSAAFEPRVVNGLLWVRPAAGADRQLTTTPAQIRNVMMSPNDQSVFFEQYMGMRLGWQRMHIKTDGSQIAYRRTSGGGFFCIGNSITNGTGAEFGGTAGATITNSFNAGNGYPQALWLDPDVRAAGLEVYNFAFSGSPSTTIANNVVALADTDPRLSMIAIVELGRNDSDPTQPLIQLQRIKAKLKPYNVRMFGFDVPYRRGANRIGDPRRAVIDQMNAEMKAFLGADFWVDTNAHAIDPGPTGALAIARANGWIANGVPVGEPTAQDLQDFADGVEPYQLMYHGDGGDVHPADALHKANARLIKAKLVANGVFS